MSMRIFDTYVLIDYLKNKPEAVDFLKQCVRVGEQLACSVITVAELLTGIRPPSGIFNIGHKAFSDA